jgi:preprotein translocase subunit SecG
MLTFVTIIHVVLCVFMIFVILLQPGKDAGMGAALGGGAATSAFGGRGAVTFLSKVTAICAALFFMTSLGLSFVGLQSSVAAGIEAPAPASSKPADTAPGAGGDAAAGDTGAAGEAGGKEAVPIEPQDAPAGDKAGMTPVGGAATTPAAGADRKKSPAPTKRGTAERKGGTEKAPAPQSK